MALSKSRYHVGGKNPVRHPLVQSHRGAGFLAPENTLASFLATWELGAIPEADLRTTRDGVIVAFHDETFARLVTGINSALREKGVQDVTFQELSAFDVGAWKDEKFAGQRICSLEQIFATMQGYPDRTLYMDVKDVNLSRLADLVRSYDVADQVILAAPGEQLLRAWQQVLPRSQTLLWMGILRHGDEAILWERLDRLRREEFAGITQVQIHVEAVRGSDHWQFKPSLEFLRETGGTLKASGVLFQVLPWECADVEVYRLLLHVGVESFASDYPDVAVRVLREWGGYHATPDT